MKKNVLLASVLIASAGAFAQNGKIRPQNAVPVIAAQKELRMNSINENVSTPRRNTSLHQPKNQRKGTIPTVTSVSATRFSGSMNVYGVLVSQSKPLHYNKDVDIVTFAHRKSPYFTTNPANNTGSIIFSWSLNRGSSWDSTCVWADGTKGGRYPQGGVYNPPGNTDVNNIYFVGTGPVAGGSGWIGGFFASKSYTASVGGNNTALPSPNMQYFPTSSFGTMVHFPRNYFTYTNDGLVRAAGVLVKNANPNPANSFNYSPRGMAIFKGTYSAGSFVWSADSLLYPVVYSSVRGNALSGMPLMAWDNDGVVGYAVMIGVRQGQSGTPKNGYQPIVYKTTNSGASWALVPAFDFTSLDEVDKRLLFATGTNTFAIPFFSAGEGIDVTVDGMGRLHLVCTILNASKDNVDSLVFVYSFLNNGGCGANENYAFYYGSTTTHPTIMDFILENNNTWNGIVVDSMATEGTSDVNTCNQWKNAGLDFDARIQVSRSYAGDKIFYSWTETDTSITGHHFNVYPDLYAKGYDIYAKTVTPKMQVIGTTVNTPTVAGYGIFWHYMAPKVIDVGAGTYEIPFTFSADETFGGTSPVDHYYVQGFQFSLSDFTNPALPLSAGNSVAVGKNSVSANVYPNPTNNTTQLVVNLNTSSDIKVEIVNALGQTINSMNITKAQAGTHVVDVDLTNENAGVYFYTVTTNAGKTTGKIVKQ
jgi:hypothetical protein